MLVVLAVVVVAMVLAAVVQEAGVIRPMAVPVFRESS